MNVEQRQAADAYPQNNKPTDLDRDKFAPMLLLSIPSTAWKHQFLDHIKTSVHNTQTQNDV